MCWASCCRLQQPSARETRRSEGGWEQKWGEKGDRWRAATSQLTAEKKLFLFNRLGRIMQFNLIFHNKSIESCFLLYLQSFALNYKFTASSRRMSRLLLLLFLLLLLCYLLVWLSIIVVWLGRHYLLCRDVVNMWWLDLIEYLRPPASALLVRRTRFSQPSNKINAKTNQPYEII